LAAKGLRVRSLGTLAPLLFVIMVVAVLVLAEPDMGTAAALVFTTGVMLYIGGVKKRHLFSLAALGGIAGTILVLIEPYRLARVLTFLNPGKDYYGSGYQITHSLIALATGGFAGKGFCEGREKFFIPAPQTDMITATLAEEVGLIGMLALLSLFIIFTYRGLSIGHKSKNSYMGLMAIGITSLISLQALINIAVMSASMPATGVPLPFISYGGSHLLVILFGAGIVLSISRHIEEPMEEPELKAYESRYNRRRDRRAYISCAEYRPTAKAVRRRTAVHR
jgi:cell division protein FtsW